jgi:hypothetical protein
MIFLCFSPIWQEILHSIHDKKKTNLALIGMVWHLRYRTGNSVSTCTWRLWNHGCLLQEGSVLLIPCHLLIISRAVLDPERFVPDLTFQIILELDPALDSD